MILAIIITIFSNLHEQLLGHMAQSEGIKPPLPSVSTRRAITITYSARPSLFRKNSENAVHQWTVHYIRCAAAQRGMLALVILVRYLRYDVNVSVAVPRVELGSRGL